MPKLALIFNDEDTMSPDEQAAFLTTLIQAINAVNAADDTPPPLASPPDSHDDDDDDDDEPEATTRRLPRGAFPPLTELRGRTGVYDFPPILMTKPQGLFWANWFNHSPIERAVVGIADAYGFHIMRYPADAYVIDGIKWYMQFPWRQGHDGVGCVQRIMRLVETDGLDAVSAVFALAKLAKLKDATFTRTQWKRLAAIVTTTNEEESCPS